MGKNDCHEGKSYERKKISITHRKPGWIWPHMPGTPAAEGREPRISGAHRPAGAAKWQASHSVRDTCSKKKKV